MNEEGAIGHLTVPTRNKMGAGAPRTAGGDGGGPEVSAPLVRATPSGVLQYVNVRLPCDLSLGRAARRSALAVDEDDNWELGMGSRELLAPWTGAVLPEREQGVVRWIARGRRGWA